MDRILYFVYVTIVFRYLYICLTGGFHFSLDSW